MSFNLVTSLFVVLLLIVLSGIFSGTEAAFLAVSRAKLLARRKEGEKRVALTIHLKENMEKVIGTLLVCNNLVNILSSAMATSLFLQLIGDSGEYYATIIMTVLIVIFAEIIPKFYAMRRAEAYATVVTAPLSLLITVLGPVTTVFERIAKVILRFLGLRIKTGENLTSSMEELRGVIDLHGRDAESREERAMLHSVLDLADVDVEAVMVHRKNVIMLDIQDDPKKIIGQVVDSHHTRLPICDGDKDNIIGTIHSKSFLRLVNHELRGQQEISKADILEMAKKAWFIPETTTLFEQLQAFRKRREHIALVVDEYGAFQGIVTLEDIIEEIVGEIDDEYDPNSSGFWTTSRGDIIAVGTTPLRDLNRHYGWNLPDEHATTIGGLLMHKSRNIPQMGQTFMIEGHLITILRRLRNQILLLRITPRAPEQEDA